MPSLAVTAPFGFTFEPVRLLRAYASLGATTAQFYRNEQKPPTVSEALAAVREAGMSFDSIHGVFGPHIDPTGPDRAHRAECVRIYEDEGRLARDLGGPMVVVHPSGQSPDLKPIPHDRIAGETAARLPLLMEFMHRLADVGQKLGVVYLIENQPLNCPLGQSSVELAHAIAKINSPNVRMCLDTGHAHIAGDTIGVVRAVAPVLSYLHIHDNDQVLDDHRMPGDGNIDWPRFASELRAIKNNSPRMLEVFYDEAKIESLAAQGFAAKLRSMCALD